MLAAGTVSPAAPRPGATSSGNGIGVERQALADVLGACTSSNFVFWIGISHAGTLISAILRLVNAGWRRPVTRCAEVITVFALMIGAMFPIIHLGRPWLAFWLFPYPSAREIWPNFRSPLAWDFFAINTYLTGSVLFLFLPMIPDLALVRDRSTGWRRRVYGALSFGWRGTTKQWNRLESAMQIMAIAILPVAVSVHTIVSFDFSMANVPMWHSTIFGPYFVAGAIFSGIAALIIAMAVLRKALHLEQYLLPLHFENLGKLLLLMSILWAYFVFDERLTVWYGNEPHEMAVFWATQRGEYAPFYWTMVICNFVIPFAILANPKTRTIARLRHRVVRRADRHVARALPDHRALADAQAAAVLVGHLRPTAGRDDHHGGDVRGDGPALHAVREVRADHLDLGAEGRPAVAHGLGDPGRGATAVDAPRRPEPLPGTAGRGRGAAMKAIYGLYDDPHVAQQAVDNLRAAGVADADITVISSEPFDHFEFGHRDAKTAMPWIAAGAGAAGLVLTYYLLGASQTAWPLVTSGMPIVPNWTNLIIIFEMTMLSAILATVITLLVTAGIPSRGGKMYDPEVSDGYILVGVENPPTVASNPRSPSRRPCKTNLAADTQSRRCTRTKSA